MHPLDKDTNLCHPYQPYSLLRVRPGHTIVEEVLDLKNKTLPVSLC